MLTQEIDITFPGDANGVFAFKVFVDGTFKNEERDVDAKYTSRKNISISASGANAGFVNYWNEPIFAADCNTIVAHKK